MDIKLINILLVDDNVADCNFFKNALKEIHSSNLLTIVRDGNQLMKYLVENSSNLPDVLFLDLNIPVKNGIQCLSEIKGNKDLENLPVVMYSNVFSRDQEYEMNIIKMIISLGALHFIRKSPDLAELKLEINKALNMVAEKISNNQYLNP